MIVRFRNIRAREKRIKDWAKQNKISKGAKIVIIIITIMGFTYVSNLCAVMINYDDDHHHHHHVIEIDVFNMCAMIMMMTTWWWWSSSDHQVDVFNIWAHPQGIKILLRSDCFNLRRTQNNAQNKCFNLKWKCTKQCKKQMHMFDFKSTPMRISKFPFVQQ